MESKIFYNYIYLDPRKPGKFTYRGFRTSFLFEPFYIGKGKNSRYSPLDHLGEACANSWLKNKILKIAPQNVIVVKYAENLSEKLALLFEKTLIRTVGRKFDNTGLLLNMTVGGKCGLTGFKHSETTKSIISKKNKGRKRTKEFRKACKDRMSGILRTAEEKRKLCEKLEGRLSPMKGKFHSEEIKFKMKEAQKKRWVLRKVQESA